MKRYNRLHIAAATLALAAPAFAAQAQQPAAEAEKQMIEVALGEVVPEWSYTGAVSTVTAKELDYFQTTSLQEAMVGKLAGYYGNGDVRGRNSFNEGGLLVVLDGVPSPTVSLASLDPASIASVTILKDAAAKALYGPQGAQGVFVVTSRKGHSGKTTVNANANFGWQQPVKRAPRTSSYDYARLRNQALFNDGLAARYTSQELAAYQSGTGIDNDWQNLYMRNFAPTDRFNAAVAGGNDRTKFFVNAGYSQTGSMYKADFKEKYNPEESQRYFDLNTNIQVQLFSFMKMWAGTTARIGKSGVANSATNPLQLIYTTPSNVENGPVDGKIIVNETFPNSIYGEINYKGVKNVTSTDVNANFGVDFDLAFLTQGLSAKAWVGYNSFYTGQRTGTYDYSRWVRDENGSINRFGTANDDPLRWGKSSQMYYFMSFQALVDWQRTFGDHSIDLFATYLGEDRVGGSNSPGWMLPFTRIQVGGHAKYGYANRYFLQFDCTYAGSEQMRKGNQFHFSPTVSGAWVVSNEEFMADMANVSLLKLRGSFGGLEYNTLEMLPNRYLYESEYNVTKGGPIMDIYTGAGVSEGVLGNPDIKWEKSWQQNYGVDFAMFANTLRFTADYWRTRQNGVIVQRNDIPAMGGIPSSRQPYTNLGRVENQGVDLQLGLTRQLPAGINLDLNADFGWNSNKVTYGADLDYSGLNYAYGYRATGYSVGQQFGYLVDYSNGNGFYNSAAELAASGLTYMGTSPRVGDLRYRDLNGDGRIDNGDLAPLPGVKKSPSTHYGASAQLTWRNFDLYVYAQGESGRNMVLSGLGVNENVGQGVYTPAHFEAWTADRFAAGEAISYPALTSTVSSSLAANDFFTTRADYLRLKNVTLGYSLPAKLTARAGFNQIRVYFTAQNLACATNMKYSKWLDPENTSYIKPLMRSYNVGLNLKF